MDAPVRPSARPRRSATQRCVLAVGVFVSACLFLAAGAAGWGYWKLSHIDRVSIDLAAAAAGEPENYLVVGSDSRKQGDPVDPSAAAQGATLGQRSDTIMVLRIDPRAEQAVMLSFPRDLWVPIAGRNGERQRINVAYSLGKQTLVNTIQQTFGIKINHYLEIDFHGFQGLVNAIGGVPMWFDRAYRDQNSGLKIDSPGCVKLDGYSALAFARARHLEFMSNGSWHYDGTGDLGRISRQQAFIRRIINRAISKGLDNPLKVKSLVEVGTRYVSIDKGLSVQDLLALGQRFRSFDASTLNSLTLPATPFRTSGGAAVLQLDQAGAQPLLNVLRGRPLNAVPEASVDVTVLNSSGRLGEAANVAGALRRAGFGIARYGNGSDLGKTLEGHSVVQYAPKSHGAADMLARHLGAGATVAENGTLAPGQVLLFVGQDFTNVLATARPPGSVAPSAAGDSPTTTAQPTTTTPAPATSTAAPALSVPPTTAVIGQVPGDPPPGQSCS